MADCPFPAIPSYLAERRFPEESIAGARVTHVWTQDSVASRSVARASLIGTVVEEPDQMIGSVDALLLARDDAEAHLPLARPFLAAGLPVYIDKPLALTMAEAEALLDARTRPGQIFSCSALRYATELRISALERASIGEIQEVIGTTPNSWKTYAPHVIDPALQMLSAEEEAPSLTRAEALEGSLVLHAEWENGRRAHLQAIGPSFSACISFDVIGESGSVRKEFTDSFSAFKGALERFVGIVDGRVPPMSDAELLTPVVLMEAGMSASH